MDDKEKVKQTSSRVLQLRKKLLHFRAAASTGKDKGRKFIESGELWNVPNTLAGY